MNSIRLTIGIVAALVGASLSFADTLHLKDGRALQGQLIRQSPDEVTFEIHRFGAKMSQTFPRSQIDRVETTADAEPPPGPVAKTQPASPPPAASGPRYMVVPIEGTIGLEVTNNLLTQALNIITVKKPDVVIMEIDSPGGYVEDMQDMIQTLDKFGKFRTAAYVKKDALSCAAIFAMACKEIVVSSKGSIGGAVIYTITPSGTPANINEKMESFLRAEFRNVVQRGGHNPLLIDAMMRTDTALYYAKNDKGKADVSSSSGAVRGSADRNKLLKSSGRILTLDSVQAVESGLAMGTAESVNEINGVLGIEKWQMLDDSVRALFSRFRHELKGAKQQFETAMTKASEFYDKADMASDYAEAARELKQCETQLDSASVLVKKYPRLGFSLEGLNHQRKRIQMIRQRLERESRQPVREQPQPRRY